MRLSYIFERKESLKHHVKGEHRLADVWDRLAAAVIDILIVGVLTNLFCAPIRKKLQAAYLADNDGAVTYLLLLVCLISFLTFIFYHTFQLYFFKKTIGKKVFKIEVSHVLHHHKLKFWSYFLRSVYLYFSILFFCLPLLEVFSNPLRRPLHDRLADSYVTGKEKHMQAPNAIEHMWVKLVFLVFVTNISIFFVAIFYFENSDNSLYSEIVVPEEYICEQVTETLENYQADSKHDVTRLETALALFSADIIEADCLEMEAERAIRFDGDLSNAYLAKAFVFEDQYELSNEYLKKVCDLDAKSEACLVSRVVDLWNEKKWNDVTELFKSSPFQKGYSQIWAIKHFDRIQNFDEVLRIADKLFPNRALTNFLSEYKTLALKSSDMADIAAPLFDSVYEAMSDEARLQFAVQGCYRDLDNNCNESIKSCKLLLDSDMVPHHLTTEDNLVVTYIKAARCGHGDLDAVIADFKNRIEDPKLQLFMAAVKAESLNKIEVSQQIYKSILKNSDSISLVGYETRLRLLDLAMTPEDLKEQVDWWIADKESPYRRSFAKKILAKLNPQNNQRGIASDIQFAESLRAVIQRIMDKDLK